MVKKLQALKAKKGFTLVELIVVIAIIGVLAAILIPTLASQITKSKVTSADSTAKELVQTVNAWIADDVAQGGAEKTSCVIVVAMTKGLCSVDQDTYSSARAVTATAVTDKAKQFTGRGATGTAGCVDSLAERFAADYSSRTFYGEVFVDDSGYAVYASFVPDTDVTPAAGSLPDASDFKAATFTWKDAKKEGVLAGDASKGGGKIVGTSPKLVHKTGATT